MALFANDFRLRQHGETRDCGRNNSTRKQAPLSTRFVALHDLLISKAAARPALPVPRCLWP